MPLDLADSQFFIMHKKSPHLDGQYAGFGKVTEGLDIADKIANTRTDYRDNLAHYKNAVYRRKRAFYVWMYY